jgi:Cu+-exporting ATPase
MKTVTSNLKAGIVWQESKVVDPVCGMQVDPATARGGSHLYKDRTYFFCNPKCREKFQTDPESHLKANLSHPANSGPNKMEATAPSAGKTQYTCPMHPQIVRDEPGNCPICGMTLEPITASLQDKEDPELKMMTRRFWVGVCLSVPLLGLSMGKMMFGSHPWVEFALATPVVLWGAWPFFVRGARSVMMLHLNMFTLIALGTGAAYFYSVVAVLFPRLFPDSFRDASGGLALYFEAAAIITTLVLLGQVLELKARSQTSSAIKALLGLSPKTAKRL